MLKILPRGGLGVYYSVYTFVYVYITLFLVTCTVYMYIQLCMLFNSSMHYIYIYIYLVFLPCMFCYTYNSVYVTSYIITHHQDFDCNIFLGSMEMVISLTRSYLFSLPCYFEQIRVLKAGHYFKNRSNSLAQNNKIWMLWEM